MTTLPYEIDPKYDLFKILEHPHEIPYHSRPFMWKRDKNIEQVVRQAIQKFRSGQQHWVGFVIVYSGSGSGSVSAMNKHPCISDGQHRLTVFALMFQVCCELLGDKTLLSKISQYGSEDLLGETATADDAEMLAKNDWKRMPNLRSVYEHDLEAFGNILNGCLPTSVGDQNSSLLYGGYKAIREILETELTAEERRPFLQAIYKNSKVVRMVITDLYFALEIFDNINNIKVPVPPLFLLKNVFTRALGDSQSAAIHQQFQRWERLFSTPIEFDQITHMVAMLFTQKWAKADRYPYAVAERLEELESSIAFSKFTEVYERVLQIHRWMTQENAYGRILARFAGGHEVFHWCLIPILFAQANFKQSEPLLRALLAFGIRYPGRFSFAPYKFRMKLVDDKAAPIQALIEGRMSVEDATIRVRELLREWLEHDDMPFQDRMRQECFRTTGQFVKARAALLYILERTDSHEAVFDHTAIDIDHISPRNPRKGDPVLTDELNTHRIGNLTPFIGKNSAAGLKGNRSAGNLPYSVKRELYGQSNIRMTRDVAALESFGDAQIVKRSKALATLLDQLTAEDIGL
jgi:hypothetical protein